MLSKNCPAFSTLLNRLLLDPPWPELLSLLPVVPLQVQVAEGQSTGKSKVEVVNPHLDCAVNCASLVPLKSCKSTVLKCNHSALVMKACMGSPGQVMAEAAASIEVAAVEATSVVVAVEVCISYCLSCIYCFVCCQQIRTCMSSHHHKR